MRTFSTEKVCGTRRLGAPLALGRAARIFLQAAMLAVFAAPADAQNAARRRDADLIDLVGVPRRPEVAAPLPVAPPTAPAEGEGEAGPDLAARVLRAAGVPPPPTVPLVDAMGVPVSRARTGAKVRNVAITPLPEKPATTVAAPAKPAANPPVADPASSAPVFTGSISAPPPPVVEQPRRKVAQKSAAFIVEVPAAVTPPDVLPVPAPPAPSVAEPAVRPGLQAATTLTELPAPPLEPAPDPAESIQFRSPAPETPALAGVAAPAPTVIPPIQEARVPPPRQRPTRGASTMVNASAPPTFERTPSAIAAATVPPLEDDEIATGSTRQREGGARSGGQSSTEWDLPRAPRSRARPALDQPAAQQAAAQSSAKIAYVVRAQPLDGVLREVGQLADLRIVVGPSVRAVVRDRRLEGPAMQVIERLARDYSLFWFADGGAIHVDSADNQKTRIFKVRGASPGQIEQSLAAAGLARHRDRVQLLGNDGTVRVTGPESFLRAVEAALNGVDSDRSGAVKVVKFGQRTQ